MRLHRHQRLQPLSGEISLPQYKDILKAFYGFYEFQEKRFAEFHGIFDDEATPLVWLEKDFAELKMDRPAPTSGIGGGLREKADQAADYAEYIGYLYVKQGSTLGGQVISAHLKKELGLEKGRSIFFFNGYGRKTGEVWRGFLEFLENQEESIAAGDVVKSAKCVFSDLDAHMTEFKSM